MPQRAHFLQAPNHLCTLCWEGRAQGRAVLGLCCPVGAPEPGSALPHLQTHGMRHKVHKQTFP